MGNSLNLYRTILEMTWENVIVPKLVKMQFNRQRGGVPTAPLPKTETGSKLYAIKAAATRSGSDKI